jgi:RNA polymerase sigma factor (sigma-70 family)
MFPTLLIDLDRDNSIWSGSDLNLMAMARDQAVDEDAELLRAHLDGDREAFARLYDKHDRLCFQFIRRLLGSSGADAEDLHQETWLAVSRHASSFDSLKASFGAWLYTIARRKVWDHFRKQTTTRLVLGQDDLILAVPDLGPTPLQQAESRETALALIHAVEALPLAQRETFILFAEGGLSLEEIAGITEVSAETSKSRLRYARATLRRVLSEREVSHG